MRINDDQRREVAARLRNFEQLRDVFRASSVCALCEVLGVGYMDWEHICARLADLIDRPTCHAVKHETHYGSFGCEEAGELWTLSCGDECINDSDFPPSYCPECGAIVSTSPDASKVDGK